MTLHRQLSSELLIMLAGSRSLPPALSISLSHPGTWATQPSPCFFFFLSGAWASFTDAEVLRAWARYIVLSSLLNLK